MKRVGILLAAVAAIVAGAQVAMAQQREKEPIGKFVADVRAAMPRFPDDPSTVSALGVTADNMPGRGFGLSLGAHVYPFRLGKVTFGFGGEFLNSHASNTLEPTTSGGTAGPTVETRFTAFSPQMSLNFGSRMGWSYLSVGLGRASFTTERKDAPVADATSNPRALNYGGGARWFAKEHLAFTFDIRFYRLDPQDAVTGRPAYGGRKITVLSAGVSVK
jgi:hypothetical protein